MLCNLCNQTATPTPRFGATHRCTRSMQADRSGARQRKIGSVALCSLRCAKIKSQLTHDAEHAKRAEHEDPAGPVHRLGHAQVRDCVCGHGLSHTLGLLISNKGRYSAEGTQIKDPVRVRAGAVEALSPARMAKSRRFQPERRNLRIQLPSKVTMNSKVKSWYMCARMSRGYGQLRSAACVSLTGARERFVQVC